MENEKPLHNSAIFTEDRDLTEPIMTDGTCGLTFSFTPNS